MDPDISLKRQSSVLPKLYQAGLCHVLWVADDVIWGDLWNASGNEGAERSKVPL
jgi:hypothetical protein